MLFVCKHCNYEMEGLVKPHQCPDCGKVDEVRPATQQELSDHLARKGEDVWANSAAIRVS